MIDIAVPDANQYDLGEPLGPTGGREREGSGQGGRPGMNSNTSIGRCAQRSGGAGLALAARRSRPVRLRTFRVGPSGEVCPS